MSLSAQNTKKSTNHVVCFQLSNPRPLSCDFLGKKKLHKVSSSTTEDIFEGI